MLDLIERLRADAADLRRMSKGGMEYQARQFERAAAALEAAREDACVSLVADIRRACGDNGKRMQPELVEYIRELAKDAERWRALREMDGWQPIETAPKDGTRVLLWFEWHDLPVVGDFHHGRWWCVHSVGGNLVYNNGGVLEPTHWRPLPAPPAIARARRAS